MAKAQGKLAVGVIGVGAIGRLHAQHLARRVAGASLAAIADVDRDAAEQYAAQLGAPAAYADYHKLLADSAIEAVVISSPADTHAQIIEEAAKAGKHIFCEKPIDCELGKIDRALAAVARAGVKLQIGFNRRFDANFRYVREEIASAKIGRPLTIHIISRDPKLPDGRPVPLAEALLDMTIHDFDMARYLTGSEVIEVYTLAGTALDDSPVPDTMLVTLRFANGGMGTIDNSLTTYGYDQRVEVFGTEGMVATGNELPHQAVLTDREGSRTALPLYFFSERYEESYVAELSAFVECVVNDTEPLVSGVDGRIAVEIALAAQRSYETGRPVSLAELKVG